MWINNDLLAECKDWKDYLERLAQNAEAAGILVLRSGIVKNNNRRKLSIDEFRGFALIDDVAPLIFINANDTTTAQIFTLIHEIVHLCIGREGISNPDPTKAIEGMRNQTEAFCNKVTAEVLVPEKKFLRDWQSTNTNSENLRRIVRFNKVSHMVALRRAFDLGKLQRDYFFKSVQADYARFMKLKEKEEEHGQGGGPDLSVLLPIRNSRKFTDSVFVALQGGKVAYTEAARLSRANDRDPRKLCEEKTCGLMRYWLDANIFITAKNSLYAFEINSSLWNWIDTQLTAKTVVAPERVFKEIMDYKKDDLLKQWASPRKDMGLCVAPSKKVSQCLSRIADHLYTAEKIKRGKAVQRYKPAQIAFFSQGADAFGNCSCHGRCWHGR